MSALQPQVPSAASAASVASDATGTVVQQHKAGHPEQQAPEGSAPVSTALHSATALANNVYARLEEFPPTQGTCGWLREATEEVRPPVHRLASSLSPAVRVADRATGSVVDTADAWVLVPVRRASAAVMSRAMRLHDSCRPALHRVSATARLPQITRIVDRVRQPPPKGQSLCRRLVQLPCALGRVWLAPLAWLLHLILALSALKEGQQAHHEEPGVAGEREGEAEGVDEGRGAQEGDSDTATGEEDGMILWGDASSEEELKETAEDADIGSTEAAVEEAVTFTETLQIAPREPKQLLARELAEQAQLVASQWAEVQAAGREYRELLEGGAVLLKHGRRGKPHARRVFGARRKHSYLHRTTIATVPPSPNSASVVSTNSQGLQRQLSNLSTASITSVGTIGGEVMLETVEGYDEDELLSNPNEIISEVFWCDKSSKDQIKNKFVSIDANTKILKGKQTAVAKRAKDVRDELFLSIVGGARSLDLQAEDRTERDAWVEALQWVVAQHAAAQVAF